MISLIFVFASLILILYFILTSIKPNNYPPGPGWFPLIGNVREFKSLSRKLGGQHLAYMEMCKTYRTSVLGMKLGNELVVAVCSYDVIRDVLRNDEFDARPDTFFIKMRTMGIKRGITSTDGEVWSVQRNFLIRHLRDLGFGKAKMDMLLLDEMKEIVEMISESKEGVQVGRVLTPGVLNVLWALVTGKRIPHDSPKLNKLLDLLSARGKAFDMSGGWLGTFPWLRFIIPEQVGYNLIVCLNKELKEFLMETIDEHLETWRDGMDDDFIYAFITEMNKKQHSSFTIDQLVAVCLDIFIAGSQTTSATIDFAILMMILRPDIQENVHKTLDAAFEDFNETVEYRHRLMVPYIEAFLYEVERCYHTTPITGPRRSLKPTKIGGYDIPENTTIFINNYSIHHDPKIWGDPENFRPERFLDDNNRVILDKHLMTFNLGGRRCLGEVLARSYIFTFFVGIMRTFKVAIQEGTPFPTGIPIPGITVVSEPYVASFTKRHI